MSQVQAGYTAEELSKKINDNVWIKDPKGSGFERIRNYDNMPGEYKEFLPKQDGFTTEKDGYKYSVKYWDTSDTFGVSRIKTQTAAAFRSGGGNSKPPFAKTIYRDAAVTVTNAEGANVLLNDRVPNGYWSVLSSFEMSGEPVFCLVRKQKLQ